MFTLTIEDHAEHTAHNIPAHQSQHRTIHDASTRLETILAMAGKGDVAHIIREYRGDSEAEYVVYDRRENPVGTARITALHAAYA